MKNLELESQVFLSEPPFRVNKIHNHLYDYLSKEVPDMVEKRKIFLKSEEKRDKKAGIICEDSSTHICLNSLENYLTMPENLLKNIIAHEYGHIIHLDKQKSANYEFEYFISKLYNKTDSINLMKLNRKKLIENLRKKITISESFACWFGDEFTQYNNSEGLGTALKDKKVIPGLMVDTYQVFKKFSKKYGRKKVVQGILHMEKVVLNLDEL